MRLTRAVLKGAAVRRLGSPSFRSLSAARFPNSREGHVDERSPHAVESSGGPSEATLPGAAVAAEWRRRRLELAAQQRESEVLRAVSLVSSGQCTDTASYNAAMAGCRRLGRPAQVLALWDQMRAASIPVDGESFQLALVCAMWLRRYSLALDLWQELEATPSITPSTVEFTAAMSACERLGEPDRALELFDRMHAMFVAPDSNTMHVAVLAAGRAHEPHRASEILSRLERSGARPPTKLYNEAIAACLHSSAWPPSRRRPCVPTCPTPRPTLPTFHPFALDHAYLATCCRRLAAGVRPDHAHAQERRGSRWRHV